MTDAVKMAIEARIAEHPLPRSEEEQQYVCGLEFALAALEQAGEPPPVKECLTTAADAGVTQGDREAAADAVKAYRGTKNDDWQGRIRKGLADDGQMVQAFKAHRLQSVAAATAAKDAEIAELAEAVRCIMARCEALEDEAHNGIATVSANGRDDTHEAGFWRGQKSTAKSIREHLHDMTRAALSEAWEAGDSLAAADRV